MTPEQIALVQSSWDRLKPIGEQAAALFYARLFELVPDARALFSGDMKEQGRNLMVMIGTAVSGLTKLEEIVPAVQARGLRRRGRALRDGRQRAAVDPGSGPR